MKPGKVVVDMGCGEARLASEVSAARKDNSITIYSFDLVAINKYVTACDMSNVKKIFTAPTYIYVR